MVSAKSSFCSKGTPSAVTWRVRGQRGVHGRHTNGAEHVDGVECRDGAEHWDRIELADDAESWTLLFVSMHT